MKYTIHHRTAYRYSEPASLSQNELFLYPRQTPHQRAMETDLTIAPEPQYRQRRTDYFGNTAVVFMVQHSHSTLTISARSIVETAPCPFPPPEGTVPWEEAVQRTTEAGSPETLEARQFVFASPMVAQNANVLAYAQSSFGPGTPVLQGAVDLMGRIFADFTYDKSATTVETSVAQVLESRRGVCQDFSHLAISCLRSLGLAARYVSGYLRTLPPPGKEKLMGADASHAWLSLFVPDAGWVDLDPTNNVIPGESHITLAWGRDYGDVTPVKGVVMGGGAHTLAVTVDVSER